MEIVDRENVKIPNSVIVSGITGTDADEALKDFLSRYGRTARTLKIDDPKSSYHKNAIVDLLCRHLNPYYPTHLNVRMKSLIRYEPCHLSTSQLLPTSPPTVFSMNCKALLDLVANLLKLFCMNTFPNVLNQSHTAQKLLPQTHKVN